MPELPDITVYVEGLQRRIVGQSLSRVCVFGPSLLRTVEPPVEAAQGRRVAGVRRLGKRIVLDFDGDLHFVIHLMIAGRLGWRSGGAARPGKIMQATFDFSAGVLLLTEAGTKKRASLHVVQGEAALAAHDPRGLDILACDASALAAALRTGNHTLKRALTNPRLIDGIGNAYSDEIQHAARLSPIMLTGKLSDQQIARLHAAAVATLTRWTDELRRKFARRFPGPGDITAFRAGFAVHGKFGQPCPDCGTKVQRIRYADNETNYCPRCQTGGRLLADRSLSRLLKDDWPRLVEEADM